MTEISQFFKRSGKLIVPLTVREILGEEIARKLVQQTGRASLWTSGNFT